MKTPLARFMVPAFVCAVVPAVPALADTAPVKAPPVSVCGVATATGPISEPPQIDVWKLPRDAAGRNELILSVHRDRSRFCYRYTANGATQTEAPTIRVRRGERFALRIVNELAGPSRGASAASTALPKCLPNPMPMDMPAGHYVGYLNHEIDDRFMRVKPVDTNIHLHGFEGPAAQENVFLSTLSTPMHACEYDVTIPKTQPPGTYFYHPHVHGASETEMAGGLAGTWIVEPDTPQISPSADHVLVLRYGVPFANDNLFAPNTDAFGFAAMQHIAAIRHAKPVRYDPFNPPAWPLAFPMRAGGLALEADGCDGVMSESLITVDGASTPAALDVPAGQTQLLRIVNATSDSAKLLQLRDAAGKALAMHVVEMDGVPVSGDDTHPLAHYESMNELMLSPSSRASILVSARPGETLSLWSEHFCEGADAFYQMPHQLVRIRGIAQDDPGPIAFSSRPVVDVHTPAADLIAYARAHPAMVRRRAVTFTEYVLPGHGAAGAHGAFFITDTTNPNFHEHSFWPEYRKGQSFPDNADIVVKKGGIEEWYVFNTTMESHVFHIHQMAFVEERGPTGAPATVDTTFVPIGKLLPNPRDPNYPLVQPSLTKVYLDFRHVPRGTFVFHCHMLFHEDHGMMGIIRVE